MKFKELFTIFVTACILLELAEANLENCQASRTYITSRVFGGQRLRKEKIEVPWLVALYKRRYGKFFCAGSLISEKHVLSAAHCFHEKNDALKREANEVLCKLGRHDLSDAYEDGAQNYLVSDIVVHPSWNFTSAKYDSDIAIIVLLDLVEFNDYIQTICLPTPNYNEVSGMGLVVGWGKSEHSEGQNYDPTPSKVEVPAVNSSYCYSTYPKLAQHAAVSVFCGGYEDKGKAPCMGDSGGGFYIKTKDVWNVRGIVSGSLSDNVLGCDINKFQFYTNVARYIEWITKVMEKTLELVWKYVKIECLMEFESSVHSMCEYGYCLNVSGIGALCNSSSYNGPNAQNIKLKPYFPLQPFSDSAIVNKLQINLRQDMNGIGEAFPNLELLNIEGNPGSTMASIEQRHFEKMPNLRALAFTYAEHTKVIAEFAFNELTNLEFLAFRETGIEHLPENVFWNLSKLKALISYGNPFSVVHDNLFRDLSELEVLWLRNCDIRDLTRKSLATLRNLEELDLSENPISIIDDEVFKNLGNLKRLELYRCELKTLPAKLFETNLKLERVNLYSNRLKSIQVVFSTLRNIQEIDLSGNDCMSELYSSTRTGRQDTNLEKLDSIVRRSCN